MRTHLEAAARRGNAHAKAKLEGPEFPESLDYLHGWLHELHGRSGVGVSGLAPMTYETIAAWSALTGQQPDALDVNALLRLDSVLLSPPDEQEHTRG